MLKNNFYNLFLGVPDTVLAKNIEEVEKAALEHSEIYTRIDRDLDQKALEKKKVRHLDKQYKNIQTPFFNEGFQGQATISNNPDSLEIGCPRMSAEDVFLFILLEGYWGSITDKRAVEAMRESISLYIYYSNKGKKMPKPATIRENVRNVSFETLEYIHQCQMSDFLNEGLDDFNYLILDSTSVSASSSWPTDAAIIYKLLQRAHKQSQKLSKFGIKDIPTWHIADWMPKLKKLLFEINNTKGTSACPKAKKIRVPYQRYLKTAHSMNQYLIREFEQRALDVAKADLVPRRRFQLQTLWGRLEDDLLALSSVLYYTEERVFSDVKLPSVEKILSLSDVTAGFIKKGQRSPVIGYKPQLGMSKNGFVTAFLLDKGNVADSDFLFPLTQKHLKTTGVIPGFLSTDDGYSSKKGRCNCLNFGVKDVCFSGAVGKKIIGDELWENQEYIAGRRKRSAIESLMFVLKYVFYFGRMRRAGIEEVRKEMLTKIIAYNYRHKQLIRKRVEEEKLQKAG